MSVEDLNEHKQRKQRRSLKENHDWLGSVYNPKIFRQKKPQERHSQEESPTNFRLAVYIATMTIVVLLILAVAVLKKQGLIE